MEQQSTHWYKAGGGRQDGFTADPRQAPASEIERVGLHDCDTIGCPVAHAGNKTDYEKED